MCITQHYVLMQFKFAGVKRQNAEASMQNVGLFNLIALTIKIIEPRQCEAECRLPPSSEGNQNQVVRQLHQSPKNHCAIGMQFQALSFSNPIKKSVSIKFCCL